MSKAFRVFAVDWLGTVSVGKGLAAPGVVGTGTVKFTV